MSCCTSLICLLNCDWPLVVFRFAMPAFLASSLIDLVSAMRKGVRLLLGLGEPDHPALEVEPLAAERGDRARRGVARRRLGHLLLALGVLGAGLRVVLGLGTAGGGDGQHGDERGRSPHNAKTIERIRS
jgi:hypothetical protein